MCGEDEYMHQEFLSRRNEDNQGKLRLVLTEAGYDLACNHFGPNCGYDPKYVNVVRGYPKFDNKKK